MKILDRYTGGLFLRNLLLALLALSFLFFFQSLLPDVYEHRYAFEQILVYHAMNLPQIITQMAPPSVLLATVMTFSALSRHYELIACYALGWGVKRVLVPIFVMVGIFCLLLLTMQNFVLPSFFQARMHYRMTGMEKKMDFFLDLKRDKIWYRSNNMIYNINHFDDSSQTIHGIFLYTFDDQFELIEVLAAEKAKFVSPGWKLLKGNVTVFSKESPFPVTKNFEEKEVLIAESPKDFLEIEKEVEGLRFPELLRYIWKMKEVGASTRKHEVRFHARISLSFIPVIMCFLAIPFSVSTRREGGLIKDLSICFIVIFFYWLFYSIGLSMGTNGSIAPWLAAWLPSGLFFLLATALLSRN
jgi:lipopolysaccharide export system permease protein